MCGIAGIWYRDRQPVDFGCIESMTDSLVHRGPDGAGVYIGTDGIALGHRRLKIIDLSDAAAQPVWLPDRSLCMVYNGEIHNYLELGRELTAAGARLRALNDTEVLLWAYKLWGEDCFERLNGMWAAAFWEPHRQQLLLSRDRFGIKPLYYSQAGVRVAFASEPKAILAAFPQEREADSARLRTFVRNSLADPDGDGHTFFKNVRALSPGCVMRIREDGMDRRKFWSFEPGQEIHRPDAAEEFLHLLRDSVRIRLRSDVPVGVLLSGGLDSSTVARLAEAEVSRPLECVSLRYDSAAIDESHYARMVASDPNRYNIHWVTPSPRDLLRTMASIVWHHDAPTPMRGRYPQWHVLKEASRFVTVVLGGQGADELLGGYDRFMLPYLRDRLDPIFPQTRSRWRVAGEIIRLGGISVGAHRILPFHAKALLMGWLRRRFGRLASRKPQTATVAAGVPFERPYRSKLNNALWNEFRHSGLPEVLHAEDSLSMAFSLESRLPFLDHRVVEFCFGLAFDEKICDGWTKHLLRRAAVGVLPEDVRLRRRKLGFPGNYAGWLGGLGQDEGLDTVRGLLLEKCAIERAWLDGPWIKRTFGHSRERANQWVTARTEQTWRLVTAELWSRLFIDGDPSMRPAPASRRDGA
jgi:asparagine synthase (glutamine-hydrolysing)